MHMPCAPPMPSGFDSTWRDEKWNTKKRHSYGKPIGCCAYNSTCSPMFLLPTQTWPWALASTISTTRDPSCTRTRNMLRGSLSTSRLSLLRTMYQICNSSSSLQKRGRKQSLSCNSESNKTFANHVSLLQRKERNTKKGFLHSPGNSKGLPGELISVGRECIPRENRSVENRPTPLTNLNLANYT